MAMAKTTDVVPSPKTATPSQDTRSLIGPFLGGAFFVERVLTEVDGVNSFMRWVDKIGLSEETIAGNKVGEIIAMPLTMVVSFRSGACKESLLLTVIQVSPLGETFPIGIIDIPFNGPDVGNVNIFTRALVKWESPGQYWFDINLGGKFITRMGLYVDAAKDVNTNAENSNPK